MASRKRFNLGAAFDALELDDPVGFEVFKNRLLDSKLGDREGEKRPTLDQLGREHGVTRERVRQWEQRTRNRINREMRDHDSPIRVAAARVQARFGRLARAEELTVT